MALPLQPDPRPTPPHLRRWLLLAALILIILVVGLFTQARRTPVQLILTDPAADQRGAYPRTLERLIGGARSDITIAMFVIHASDDGGDVDRMLQTLGAAAARGIRVRMVIDRGSDWKTGQEDPKHIKPLERLRALGIDAVTDRGDSTLHAKCVIVDRRWVLTGSHNWTYSAWQRNREASLLLDDPELAERLTGMVEAAGWGEAARRP